MRLHFSVVVALFFVPACSQSGPAPTTPSATTTSVPQSTSFAGVWDISSVLSVCDGGYCSPQDTQPFQLRLTQLGSSVSGVMTGHVRSLPAVWNVHGEVIGDELALTGESPASPLGSCDEGRQLKFLRLRASAVNGSHGDFEWTDTRPPSCIDQWFREKNWVRHQAGRMTVATRTALDPSLSTAAGQWFGEAQVECMTEPGSFCRAATVKEGWTLNVGLDGAGELVTTPEPEALESATHGAVNVTATRTPALAGNWSKSNGSPAGTVSYRVIDSQFSIDMLGQLSGRYTVEGEFVRRDDGSRVTWRKGYTLLRVVPDGK